VYPTPTIEFKGAKMNGKAVDVSFFVFNGKIALYELTIAQKVPAGVY
jgi:hypothetical protein